MTTTAKTFADLKLVVATVEDEVLAYHPDKHRRGLLLTATALDASQAAAASAGARTSTALHPHLMFLKTGGGSTVAEPQRNLSMQQLQRVWR